jgi:Ca2+-binding EF-hand superfamily protein
MGRSRGGARARVQGLSKMGVNGFRSMEKAFNEFDTDGSKALDSGEFTRALAFVNICLTPSETQVVMDCFDTDNNGKVDLTEFCAQLKFMDNQL